MPLSSERALVWLASGFVLVTPGSVFSIGSFLAYPSLCDPGTATTQRHPGARLASLGSPSVPLSAQIQRKIRDFALGAVIPAELTLLSSQKFARVVDCVPCVPI